MTGYAPRAVSGLRNLAATEREKSLSCSPMKTMLMVLIAICHSVHRALPAMHECCKVVPGRVDLAWVDDVRYGSSGMPANQAVNFAD